MIVSTISSDGGGEEREKQQCATSKLQRQIVNGENLIPSYFNAGVRRY